MADAEALEEAVRNKLTAEVAPVFLALEDISGGCGTSFKCVIVSEKFEQLT